ncbi:MAG: LEA type 2 family protein [Spongiibacteraceae bacterium]
MLAGIEPLPSEGLELRMLVKLRVQNPNDKPIEFNGVFIEMDMQGKRFASGVSAATGSVPRYGETVVNVPVSISALSLVQQAIGAARDEFRGRLAYRLRGKISGPSFGSVRINSSGELTLPADMPERTQ